VNTPRGLRVLHWCGLRWWHGLLRSNFGDPTRMAAHVKVKASSRARAAAPPVGVPHSLPSHRIFEQAQHPNGNIRRGFKSTSASLPAKRITLLGIPIDCMTEQQVI
jgi:hypothetical protein